MNVKIIITLWLKKMRDTNGIQNITRLVVQIKNQLLILPISQTWNVFRCHAIKRIGHPLIILHYLQLKIGSQIIKVIDILSIEWSFALTLISYREYFYMRLQLTLKWIPYKDNLYSIEVKIDLDTIYRVSLCGIERRY